MANSTTFSNSTLFSTLFLLFISLSSTTLLPAAAAGDEFAAFGKSLNKKSLGLRKEKLSHFTFYWHDVVSGKNPTSIMVVPPQKNSSTFFGSIIMIDNALTLGPNLTSKLVGKAQGFYASASQEETGLLMVMNFAFIEGKYNGSSFTVLGRNQVMHEVREMSIVGGSGLFRFARGYVEARTHDFDLRSGDANVKYDAYVMHY